MTNTNPNITRERQKIDASYFPYQIRCKECKCKFGTDAKKDNRIYPVCIIELREKKERKNALKRI